MDMVIDYYEKTNINRTIIINMYTNSFYSNYISGCNSSWTLLPVYEENLYNHLNESLNIIDTLTKRKINSEIAYIYIDSDNNTFVSSNIEDVIKCDDVDDIMKLITNSKGKFTYKNKIYYYIRCWYRISIRLWFGISWCDGTYIK